MFKQIAILSTLTLSFPTLSQTMATPGAKRTQRSETLVDMMNTDSKPFVQGGYGAPVYKYTQIDGRDVNLLGLRGAWMLDKTYIFGAFGYGLTSNIGAEAEGKVGNLDMGYGGLLAGYNFMTYDLFHFTFLGQAGMGEMDVDSQDSESFGLADDDNSHTSDQFNVFEPEALVEANITRYFRIGAGLSYRFVGGVDNSILTRKELQGLSGTLAFNFGRF